MNSYPILPLMKMRQTAASRTIENRHNFNMKRTKTIYVNNLSSLEKSVEPPGWLCPKKLWNRPENATVVDPANLDWNLLLADLRKLSAIVENEGERTPRMKSLLLRLYDRSSRRATIRGSSRPGQDYLWSLEPPPRVAPMYFHNCLPGREVGSQSWSCLLGDRAARPTANAPIAVGTRTCSVVALL